MEVKITVIVRIWLDVEVSSIMESMAVDFSITFEVAVKIDYKHPVD